MCNPISWWLVQKNDKRELFISDRSDSHREIAAEFGIKDTDGELVAAGEFYPKSDAPSPDTSTWHLQWDAPGSRPQWLTDDGLAWLRSELESRAKAYVFSGGDSVHDVKSCRAFVFGTAKVKAGGMSSVVAWGSSSVVAWGSSSVVARGSSSVVARESSRVVARGSSSVEAWGSSSVVAWGSSSVVARESSSVEAWESSSVVAWGSSSVEAWGSSRVVASSAYATLVFRKAWDGRGYLPVWCPHEGKGTYRATPDGFEKVETAKA